MSVQQSENLKVTVTTDQPTNGLTGVGARDDYLSKKKDFKLEDMTVLIGSLLCNCHTRIGLQNVMRVEMTTIGQTLFLLLSSDFQAAFGWLDNVDFRAVEKDLHKVMVDNQSFWPGEAYSSFVGRF